MALPAAACHKGKPHGPNTCDDEGGGPVTGVPTMAAFIGPDILVDASDRACTPLELTSAAGQFDCSVEETVQVSTAAMTLAARKRDVTLCRSLEYFSHVDTAPAMTPDVYRYGWADDCIDGACQIVVDLTFSGADISVATGGKSDAVDLRVSGTLSGELNANPFDVEQVLTMNHLYMQFRKPGSTAIAAVCDWYPQSGVGGPNQIMGFTSEPDPESP